MRSVTLGRLGQPAARCNRGYSTALRPPISIRWQLCLTRVTAVLGMLRSFGLGSDRRGARQRAKAEKSVSALFQMARSTWSGVSSCGEWPVAVSSWKWAIGIAAAYARP
jgi:hypothetical protein